MRKSKKQKSYFKEAIELKMKASRPTTITPFLTVRNARKALEFYAAAFGTRILERHDMPEGKVTARLAIGDAEVFVGDEEPEFNNFSPNTIGGNPVRIVLTVDDPDAIFTRALEAGATQICPVTTEESWKIGKLTDPFGHIWEIGHPLEENGES
ncbi:MAG TPA: VOC family protein [Chryseolinea sp.]|nr:VOC family protein [Chryseolinea sp.]